MHITFDYYTEDKEGVKTQQLDTMHFSKFKNAEHSMNACVWETLPLLSTIQRELTSANFKNSMLMGYNTPDGVWHQFTIAGF